MTGKKRHALVIPAVPLVIPAEAGIQVTGRTGWISAPHGGRGGGRGPRLCLGIYFRRTQPRIYVAGECPGLFPGVHFRREGSSLDFRGDKLTPAEAGAGMTVPGLL